MKLTTILKDLKEFAKQQKFVNSVFLGSVYDNWNSTPNNGYGSINIDITSATISGNMQQLQISLYYGDRMVQDGSNEYEVKATGELVLANIINYASTLGDVFDDYTITFFRQQFADDLAGAYVEFTLEVTRDIDSCTIDEYTSEYDDLIARLYAAIEAYAQENDELSILLKDILHKLTSERV